MDLTCVGCGSLDLTKTAFVYEQGIVHGNSSSTGVGFVGGRVAYGIGATRSTQVTSTARRAAPPAKLRTPWWRYVLMYLIGAPSFFVAGANLDQLSTNPMSVVVPAAVIALLVYFQIMNVRKHRDFNRNRYPELLASWQRSYMCNRCGCIGEPLQVVPLAVSAKAPDFQAA